MIPSSSIATPDRRSIRVKPINKGWILELMGQEIIWNGSDNLQLRYLHRHEK